MHRTSSSEAQWVLLSHGRQGLSNVRTPTSGLLCRAFCVAGWDGEEFIPLKGGGCLDDPAGSHLVQEENTQRHCGRKIGHGGGKLICVAFSQRCARFRVPCEHKGGETREGSKSNKTT